MHVCVFGVRGLKLALESSTGKVLKKREVQINRKSN